MRNILNRVKTLESQSVVDGAPWVRIRVARPKTNEQALAEWMIENNATQEPENIIYRVIVQWPPCARTKEKGIASIDTLGAT